MKQHKTPAHRKLDEDYARRTGGGGVTSTDVIVALAVIALVVFAYLLFWTG